MSLTSRTSYNKGFTFVEMLVTISIFIGFTIFALANYKGFGEHQKFINFVYDVALNIRQLQTKGLAVQESAPGANSYDNGYGLRFTVGSNTSYISFTDKPDAAGNRNKTYDGSGEYVLTYHIYDGFVIDRICGVNNSNGEDCLSGGYIDMTFVRPNPDAIINVNGNTSSYKGARMYFRSPNNTIKNIYVDRSGQISIQ